MNKTIYATTSVSLTELGRDPAGVIEDAGKLPVAILDNNRASAYLVPAETFEALLELIEDIELADLVRERRDDEFVKVRIDDL